MNNIYLGIDVGTNSVRAGAFDSNGYLKGVGKQDIKIWRPKPDFVEQSSENIWTATCKAVHQALTNGDIHPEVVKGLSYDATCSLVALDKNVKPITISPTGRHEQNVIVWMDHRAIEQANDINTKGHEVLKYVGDTISPEMEPPKLMWIKKHLPDTWNNAGKFMDLADFLVFRSTGKDIRSLCTTVCKWTCLGHEGEGGRYDDSFFRQNHIEDLFDNGRVPPDARPMGQLAGELTVQAARDLGLEPGVAVGIGIIDAHAGGIGAMGSLMGGQDAGPPVFNNAIALIGGTSTCHMAVSPSPRYIKGIWGPYYGAMFPGMWLNEGGQSATGALIDHIIEDNAAYPDLVTEARQRKTDIYTYLNQTLERLVNGHGLALFNNRHLLPDHHGNRSPRADATAKGLMSGLTLNRTIEETAVWYGAAIHAIAYGTRHIIEEMNATGYDIKEIYMCGGHLKNDRFIKDHATITGCSIVIPEEKEAVLLGSAVLGAVAAGTFPDIFEAMKTMCRAGKVVEPDLAAKPFHDVKYKIFKEMAEFQAKIHQTMETLQV